jgi:hypothetical protein
MQLIFIAISIAFVYSTFWIIDQYKYAPGLQKLKCKRFGHDYHGGITQNLLIENDGEKFEYDFCQRCHQTSEYRPLIGNNGRRNFKNSD